MRTAKFNKITETIHQMMLVNKIDSGIINEASGKMSDGFQSDKCFIYVELRNTNPMITCVFNTDEDLMIGRDVQNSAICIQDEYVSRLHARIMLQDDYLYIQNCSESQYVKVRRGLKRIWLSCGDSVWLKHSDTVYIGPVKLKFWLFKGKKWIMN